MSKDKDIILFDDIEWGNKTLPGLSDEELMTKDWRRVPTKSQRKFLSKVSKEFWSNLSKSDKKAFLKKRKKAQDLVIEEYRNSPKMQEKKKKTMQKLAQDPEWIANQFIGAKKRAENYKNPKWIEKRDKNFLKAGKKRRKYVMTPDGIMKGYVTVANYYKISLGSLRDRMIYRPNEYYYCDKDGNKVLQSKLNTKQTTAIKEAAKVRRKPVMTPAGQFPSLRHACEHYNITGATIRGKLKSQKETHKDWYYIN